MNFVKFLSIALLCFSIFALFPCAVFAADAAPFTQSSAADDLAGTVINGQHFEDIDPASYSEATLLFINEYGYGTDEYALYVYVATPHGASCCEYESAYIVINGHLKTMTLVGEFDDSHLIKFVVDDPIGLDVSDVIRIYAADKLNVKLIQQSPLIYVNEGITSGSKFTYTGSDATGDKTLTVNFCEVIDLELGGSVYRTPTSNKPDAAAYDIFTAWFSIPGKYLDTYERLNSIKASYLEYELDAWITNDLDIWDKLLAMKDRNASWDFYDPSYAQLYEGITIYSVPVNGKFGCVSKGINVSTDFTVFDPITRIDNVLYMPFEATKGAAPNVIVKDPKKIKKWTPISNPEPISSQPENYYEITAEADDTFDILSYTGQDGKGGSWLKRIFNGLLNVDEFNQTGISVFRPVSFDMLESYVADGDNAALAKELIINVEDLPEFVDYAGKELQKGNDVYLFRYATRDYYSTWYQCEFDNNVLATESDMSVFLSTSTLIDEFDIITLGFYKDGLEYVYPVAAEPLGPQWGGISPPRNLNIFGSVPDFSWLKILIAVVGVLLLVSVIAWISDKIRKIFGPRRRN